MGKNNLLKATVLTLSPLFFVGCATSSIYQPVNLSQAATIYGVAITPDAATQRQGTYLAVEEIDGKYVSTKNVDSMIDPGVHEVAVSIQKKYAWSNGGNYMGDAVIKKVTIQPKGQYQLVCICDDPKKPAVVQITQSDGKVIAQSSPISLTQDNLGGVKIVSSGAGTAIVPR